MDKEQRKQNTEAQFALQNISVSVLEEIRQAFADYRRAEGCKLIG